MCTKSGVLQGYAQVFHVKQNWQVIKIVTELEKQESSYIPCYMKMDGRTGREYFWQWQDKSWNKDKNRETEEQLVYLQQRNPSLAPNLHVNNCCARHINASQLFGCLLGLCTWLNHWETMSCPYISKIYCIPFTYILHILLRAWCDIQYAIYI